MANVDYWDYFMKVECVDGENKALCTICNELYSYSNQHNLKSHLQRNHLDVILKATKKSHKSRRSTHQHKVWNYFVKTVDDSYAKCKVCYKDLSYKTTVANLACHLQKLHPEQYEKYLENKSFDPDVSGCEYLEAGDDNDVEDLQESQKLNEIWNYFEQEGSRARCVVCREAITDTDYEHLKAHLFEHHPKLLLHLVQDQEERQETKSSLPSDGDDNDNTYTEVVYLEQDSAPEDSRTIDKPNTHNAYPQNRAIKRQRNNSSSDHPIIKLKNDKKEEPHEEETELEAFIKYIRCLLKKLTPDAFSKVQVDILKTIMDAQYSQRVTVTDNSAGNSILTDIASGSVANVIRVSEIAPESSSLLGNYTVTLAAKNDELESTRD